MKSKLIIMFLVMFFAVFLFAGDVSALNLEIEKIAKVPVVISELNDPAVFNFVIDNNGAGDNVEIYSLVGVSFEPKGTFYLPSGRTTLNVLAYPGESARAKGGTFSFEYQIKGSGDNNIFKDTLSIKIVSLRDLLSVEPLDIVHGSENVVIRVRNLNNIEVRDAKLNLKSVFFEGEKTFSLRPLESTEIVLPVKTDIQDVAAGAYVVSLDLAIGDASARFEDSVNYLEKKNVAITQTRKGFLIITTKITKTNNGNLAVKEETGVSKNVLTRLFTTFSTEPLTTERSGLFVSYKWEESWILNVRTNYTLPFILVLLVVLSAYFVYLYSRTSLVLKKRCSFVRTKGGEFALKVIINVKTKNRVENVELFDRIPLAAKLYQGSGMPHKFDERTGKLSWVVNGLNSGEERIFSYIIYSKLRIVGRLELPVATAHFVKDGKSAYVHSNKAYFASEIAPRY